MNMKTIIGAILTIIFISAFFLIVNHNDQNTSKKLKTLGKKMDTSSQATCFLSSLPEEISKIMNKGNNAGFNNKFFIDNPLFQFAINQAEIYSCKIEPERLVINFKNSIKFIYSSSEIHQSSELHLIQPMTRKTAYELAYKTNKTFSSDCTFEEALNAKQIIVDNSEDAVSLEINANEKDGTTKESIWCRGNVKIAIEYPDKKKDEVYVISESFAH